MKLTSARWRHHWNVSCMTESVSVFYLTALVLWNCFVMMCMNRHLLSPVMKPCFSLDADRTTRRSVFAKRWHEESVPLSSTIWGRVWHSLPHSLSLIDLSSLQGSLWWGRGGDLWVTENTFLLLLLSAAQYMGSACSTISHETEGLFK